jgi:Protein of unknown function (DUF2637)
VKRLRWPRTKGPSNLQLWRARHISVIRIAERERKAAERAARPAKLRGDWLVRWATVLAVVAVAGVAAYVSYWHAVEVVTHHGETDVRGHLYPVAIDGLIVAASLVMLDAARHIEEAPKLAWLLLLSGIGVTLAANVAFGLTFGLAGALWAAWPALAFVGCYELLMSLVRAAARRAGPEAAGTLSPVLPNDAETAALASMRATMQSGNPWSANQLQARFGLTRAQATKVRELVTVEANGHAPDPGESPPDE